MNVTGLPRNRGVNADWIGDAYLMAGTLEGKGVWLVEGDEMNCWWVIVRERSGDFPWEDEVTGHLEGEWDTVRQALLSTVPEEWMEGIERRAGNEPPTDTEVVKVLRDIAAWCEESSARSPSVPEQFPVALFGAMHNAIRNAGGVR